MFNFINCDLYATYWCPMIGNKLYSIQFYSTCTISTVHLSVYESNFFWDTIPLLTHLLIKALSFGILFPLLIKAFSFCIHSHLTSNCVLKQFCGIHFFLCIYCLSNHSFGHTFLTSNLPTYQHTTFWHSNFPVYQHIPFWHTSLTSHLFVYQSTRFLHQFLILNLLVYHQTPIWHTHLISQLSVNQSFFAHNSHCAVIWL